MSPSSLGLGNFLPDQEPLRLPEALRLSHRKWGSFFSIHSLSVLWTFLFGCYRRTRRFPWRSSFFRIVLIRLPRASPRFDRSPHSALVTRRSSCSTWSRLMSGSTILTPGNQWPSTFSPTLSRRHSKSKRRERKGFRFREVTKKYIGKGVFAEFNRQMPETIIKKTKKFKQLNFMSGVSSSEGDCSGSQLGF